MPRIAQTTTFWTLHGLYRWDFNGFNKWALIVRDPRLCLIFYFVAQIAQCIIVIGFGDAPTIIAFSIGSRRILCIFCCLTSTMTQTRAMALFWTSTVNQNKPFILQFTMENSQLFSGFIILFHTILSVEIFIFTYQK